MALKKKWDQRYRQASLDKPEAAFVLRESRHLLPIKGDALDMACGLGGNALLLAEAGLSTQAWDISPVAIETLQSRAMNVRGSLQAIVRDVSINPPSPASFDVIVVSYFLERTLAQSLCAALRPGGILFYQTFVRDKVSQQGPSNPEFLLAENELLTLFATLRLRVYREEGRLGNVQQGLRNEALLVSQKP
ncbi:MAG: class I SAM-dependent methyltransferase [Ectothiorhodospiraceae bacterium]|nr:class I SAM-dependent methyltransferase [Ectothiorhodospiraceae bacterium]